MYKLSNLKQFYDLMFYTKKIRKLTVSAYFEKQKFIYKPVSELKRCLEALELIPKKGDKYVLKADEESEIKLDISYEIGELKKDIYYLEQSEVDFIAYLENTHKNFNSQVKDGLNFLKGVSVKNFVTDRDGTINNYCGRYNSSIQSIYNAVFLARFAKSIPYISVILTSAPLKDTGLLDISVIPDGVFIYAGSKGREYCDKQGKYHSYPIKKDKARKLNELNEKLKGFLGKKEYHKFSLIGSGLQFKYGQTTIARQDIYKSITEKQSQDFLNTVQNLINDIDKDKKYFRIEDTGKDIEIILTVGDEANNTELKDYDKGNGVDFLNKGLQMDMGNSINLICGDTESDVPMVSYSMSKSKNTFAIFVTEDEELKNKVRDICPQSLFVTEPDVLITILNNLS